MSRTEVLRRALECVYSGATEAEAEALADALGLEQVGFIWESTQGVQWGGPEGTGHHSEQPVYRLRGDS